MKRPNGAKQANPALAVVVAAVLLLLGAQALTQLAFERRWSTRKFESLLYLPTGRHLKAISLGFGNIYADFLWMRAIGYFGAHALTDQEYPWLYHILDQVTTLDPPFRYPYYFGGIALAVNKNDPEQSIKILLKGMRNYPGDWRFPFYIGFNYFYTLRDPQRAATYMNYAASLPGSPLYLPRLAASLLASSGRLEAAIRFLETMAEGARDEEVRRDILRKIEELRAGRIPESLKAFLAGKD